MAFVHCHNPECKWSQDDFWNFHFSRDGRGYFKITKRFGLEYNPISLWLSHIFGQIPGHRWDGYWRPRYMLCFSIDAEMNVIDKPVTRHSWYLAVRETWKMIKSFKNQVWWTEEEFRSLCYRDEKENKRYPLCPKCGKDQLDVD